jgi:hypothetical protein
MYMIVLVGVNSVASTCAVIEKKKAGYSVREEHVVENLGNNISSDAILLCLLC